MLKQSMAVLDAAARAGVRAVVHLGTSAAPTNAVAHWGWHRYVEAYVEKLGFAYTHLRPEAFMQNMWVYGMLAGGLLTSHVGRARWGWVDCDDLADVAAEALLRPDVHGGTAIPMAGDAKTFPEVAAILSVELGRPVTVDDRPPADFWAGATTNPDAFALAYMRCVYEQFQLESTVGIPGAGVIHDGYSAILGRPAATWRDFARRNRDRLLATGPNPGEPPAGRVTP
jgi:uncharacterized protein YbjT (DUF2867 family)